MNAGTHLIGAVAAGTLVLATGLTPFTLSSVEGVVFFASILAGGLLPDICHPFSWIGRRVGVLSMLIRKLFGHRTITHSLLFVLLLYFAAGGVPGSMGSAVQIGVTAGVLSHIILDMLTSRGVALLYPVHMHFRFPLTTKTGSLGEGIISFFLLLWILYFFAGPA
ncbi:metal-dependent hydrolase [Bacillus piscicola]|uniref:metal-dependent hydrolase n=1 Tax=Bacillus piscicola TaxID=1632684 RepID=UPI001F0907DD|nr:metal-dependent hydrolase [Bacillus piscicola]